MGEEGKDGSTEEDKDTVVECMLRERSLEETWKSAAAVEVAVGWKLRPDRVPGGTAEGAESVGRESNLPELVEVGLDLELGLDLREVLGGMEEFL